MTPPLESLLNSDRLPSLPEIALRVVRIAQEREPDFWDLAGTIKSDPALCARIMRTANSALFGLRQRPASIEAALPILGVTMVRTLVLGLSLARRQRVSDVFQDDYRLLWRHSLTQACLAESIALRDAKLDAANWFLAGLLQDIGQLAMLNFDAAKFKQLISSDSFLFDSCRVEYDTFGFHHVDLGVAMCRKWNFEAEILDAIAAHHDDLEFVLSQAESPTQSLRVALNVATRGSQLFFPIGGGSVAGHEDFFQVMSHVYGMSPTKVREMLLDVEFRVDETAVSFGIDIGEAPPIEEILTAAQAALAEIALRSQIEAMVARDEVDKAQLALEQIKSQAKQVQDRAHRDALTGLYSRGYLDLVFDEWVQECHTGNHGTALLFLDIDRFKSINDTFGHKAGDAALCKVSEILRKMTRAFDVVIRYGGDEFVVLLQNVSRDICQQVAERIRNSISAAKLPDWPEIVITTSVGAVYLDAADVIKYDQAALIAAADQAMYVAKQRGRNQVIVQADLQTVFRPLEAVHGD